MDQPSEKNSASSDVRALIAELRADLETASDQLARVTTDYEEMLSDQDTIQEDRDATAQAVAEARAMVDRAETAIARAEEGQYGRCEQCGSTIPKERLAALPDATTCVSCA